MHAPPPHTQILKLACTHAHESHIYPNEGLCDVFLSSKCKDHAMFESKALMIHHLAVST